MKHGYGTISITMIYKICVIKYFNIAQIIPIIVGASHEVPSGKSEMRWFSGIGIGRVVTSSPARGVWDEGSSQGT
jgi:hypothetical protein